MDKQTKERQTNKQTDKRITDNWKNRQSDKQ